MRVLKVCLKGVAAGALLLLGTVCDAGPVQIDFFYEPGCHDCERIESEILPELDRRFGDSCLVRRHDIGVKTNFIYLLQLEHAVGYEGTERGYLVVEQAHVFGPHPDVKELCSVISNSLFRVEDVVVEKTAAEDLVEKRFAEFTLFTVIAAGLLDGMNPCAFSTLVFFMSLLAVSRVRNRQLLAVGGAFCLASFATYLALGFGLLRFLHLLSGFSLLRSVLEQGMMVLLLVFAVLSFRDAFRFRKSGQARDVTLQLSAGMKKRIHSVMRRGLKTGHLIFGGLLIGMLVTALESVCTGQVYVPTLVLILKDGALADSRAWLYLLSYNLFFILPLVLIFSAVYCGLKTETLLAWSRSNVVISKSLLGLFFVLMAALLLYL